MLSEPKKHMVGLGIFFWGSGLWLCKFSSGDTPVGVLFLQIFSFFWEFVHPEDRLRGVLVRITCVFPPCCLYTHEVPRSMILLFPLCPLRSIPMSSGSGARCERCLSITESPKTPGHYRYLIWVLVYIAYTGLAVFSFANFSCSCVYCDFDFLQIRVLNASK